MPVYEERVQVLIDLGLTYMQAKVYIALLHLKNATARNIQKLSNLARQDVYPVLTELTEKGLVEKIIAKPTKFRPVPPEKAISILTQKRNKQNQQMQNKATQAFSNFKDNCVETPLLQGGSQFVLLSRSETNPTACVDKLGKAVADAKKSVMCSTTLPLFRKVKFMDEQVWRKGVEKGVKFKFIIARRPSEEPELALDPALENSENFKARWTSTVLPSCVLLVDEKEAFCRIGSDVDCPVLWSAAPSFVALIKDYFENKWKLLDYSQKQQVSSKIY